MTSFIVFKGWEEEEEEKEEEEEEEEEVEEDEEIGVEEAGVASDAPVESPLLTVHPFLISSDSSSTALRVHSRSPSVPSIFLDSA